jgi:hypothetical protein
VDRRPHPGMRHGVRMAIDRHGRQHADDAVVRHNQEESQQKRAPILVEGDEGHGDKEMKVRLDVAVREMHEHRPGHREACGGQGRADQPSHALPRGQSGYAGQHEAGRRAHFHGPADEQAEARHRDRVQKKQAEKPTMTSTPFRIGQDQSLGNGCLRAAPQFREPAACGPSLCRGYSNHCGCIGCVTSS